ncbi:hypothetical protein EYZ11_009904 [Aspergillus tanneri]|uniref:CFEM domain-containing protein n=1 Tax=Aspergillus tanneri TaxID=1220188 RepID=A0A4S3J6Y2_9EURO|nr:hypothetical protein EYZ11_009904 [Aspergillus tanneri]
MVTADCLETCISKTGLCTAPADIKCYCSNPDFQAKMVNCIKSDCPDQYNNALGLQNSVC